MVKGVAIDSLHVFFLGVVQDLLKYWFDKHYRTSSFSIYSKVNYSCKYNITVTYIVVYVQLKQCDRRLLSIHVPDIISRPPKSLTDYSHWKGT